MTRQWRIEFEGALYYVLSRTISSLRPTDRICQNLLLYLLMAKCLLIESINLPFASYR